MLVRSLMALGLTALLAACGADGAPMPPSDDRSDRETRPQSGISVTGSIGVGVSGGSASGTVVR